METCFINDDRNDSGWLKGRQIRGWPAQSRSFLHHFCQEPLLFDPKNLKKIWQLCRKKTWWIWLRNLKSISLGISNIEMAKKVPPRTVGTRGQPRTPAHITHTICHYICNIYATDMYKLSVNFMYAPILKSANSHLFPVFLRGPNEARK